MAAPLPSHGDPTHDLPVEAPGLEVLESRILTIPNVITVVRLASLPIFVWLLLVEHNRAAAASFSLQKNDSNSEVNLDKTIV